MSSTHLTEFLNGLVNGYGILKLGGETICEGEWKGDLDGANLHGYGIEFIGELYKGEFKDRQKDGIGTLFNEYGYYEGEFKEGNFEGYGIIHYNENNEDSKIK